jgi:hypothetical protein
MATTLFEQGIQDLNFTFITESGNSGVLLTSNYEETAKELSSPDVLFALETAKNKFNADAVYFRFFQDGRAAVPQLYIFDYTVQTLTGDERNRIHIQMWNGYQVPAYIIIEKTSVSVYDAREKPSENLTSYASEIIKLSGTAIKGFQAKSFDTGLFWEEQNEKKHFKFEQSATKDLIRGLKEVYKSFQETSGLNRHVALKLLVQCLLIKYLEERDEDSSSGYFAGTYFKRNFQCDNFCDTIRKGKLLNLLDQLGKDFNGKIFEWDKDEEQAERIAIQRSEVNDLADYLDGNVQNNQYVIWRLYSFSHLPVEVISSVYEELLTDSKDIVYTPEMIVSTLVDECMPLKTPDLNLKLIDVSCGSGIFLVKAYKRIVQWWRYEQWLKTGELVKPPMNVLRDLLLKNIHGIDIQPDAIRLSIFSLALAILDEVNLDPPTWGKLRFPDLSENIITHDFFQFVNHNQGQYNLVIGNPPFNLQPIEGKEPDRTEYFKSLKKSSGYSSEIDIPDENPALHFLVNSMGLLAANGLLCLIQPAGPLLFQKDSHFKERLFSKYNLLQLIDFTKLADKLWGRKNVSTAAIFLQKAIPDNEGVLHLIANRTFSNTTRLFLEFDHYDFHIVSKHAAIHDTFVWKANLLGGGRIVGLLERISNLRTLGEFLTNMENDYGWSVGEGFIEKGANAKPCDYITGHPYLPSDSFVENEVIKENISNCDLTTFYRKGKEKIYQPPHLLIKENIGISKLSAFLSDEYLVFRANIIGINAPPEHRYMLEQIRDYFYNYNDLLRFIIKATSSQLSISKATVPLKEDFMNLPYPEDLDEVKISNAERLVIGDVLNFQITNNQDLTMDTSVSALKDFADIVCRTLNSIYKSDDRSFQLFKILDADKYFALHFEYSTDQLDITQEVTTDLGQYIKEIIPTSDEETKGIYIQRILKIYGKNCIIIGKPKQQRYWLKSIALRDADESFADYVKSRYYAEK